MSRLELKREGSSTVMSTTTLESQEQYWNEDGGRRWISHWRKTEKMFVDLTATLLLKVGVRAGDMILEVGCGQGILTRKLAQHAGPEGRILGVDISQVILDVANNIDEQPDNVTFKRADAGKVALGDERFDLIVSRFGVMFFEDPISAFINLRRSLKGSGHVRFMCWRALKENPWLQEPAEAAFQVLSRPETPAPNTPGPFSLAAPERLQEVLTSAGFADPELIPVDGEMRLGGLEEAVQYSAQMGPAGRAMKDVDDTNKARAIEAIRDSFAERDGPEGVVFPCATWIVRTEKRGGE